MGSGLIFYYQGRKARAAPTYPAPQFPLVIEPFAGSMAYSLHWRPRLAIGMEIDERVVAIWRRLCAMTPAEIEAYPVPEVGARFSDPWMMLADQSDASLGSSYRVMTPYMHARARTLINQALRHHDYAASNVWYRHGDYQDLPNVEATWFVDPPYEGVNGYRHAAIDYAELAIWCRTRKGQLIVCEGRGDWLPFDDHHTWQGQPMNGAPNTTVMEGVYTRPRRKRIIPRRA